jgi:hypothetical protein
MTDGYTGYQHLLTGWPASSSAASTRSEDALGADLLDRLREHYDDAVAAERGAKAANQAVSCYGHSLATLARWCRIRSYLDSAAAHGIKALDAIRAAIEGRPWLPPLPAQSAQS